MNETEKESAMNEKKHHLRIHIDEKPYESPNPTTGDAFTPWGTSRPASYFIGGTRRQEDPPIPTGRRKSIYRG